MFDWGDEFSSREVPNVVVDSSAVGHDYRGTADDWMRDHLPDPEEYSLDDNDEEEDAQPYFFLTSSATVISRPSMRDRSSQELPASLDGGGRLRLRNDASLSSPSATSRSFTIA